MDIAFSPPDIGPKEVEAVTQVLQSGWLTTGPRTAELERQLSQWCGTARTVCLNSGTAALELALHLLEIGPGDEVIVPVYTYTATAAVVLHVGATPVPVDIQPGWPRMDLEQVAARMNEHTKAVLAVDLAGRMADYPALQALMETQREEFRPHGTLQEILGRPAVIADAAHSFGAEQNGVPSGSAADFTCFSFHAVKNLTTGEGGALTWRSLPGCSDDVLYRRLRMFSLHGQDRDALAKEKGDWSYDILLPGWKCNMTDLSAALGLVQLERYPALLEQRRQLYRHYQKGLREQGLQLVPLEGEGWHSSYHLALCPLLVAGERERAAVFDAMLQAGIHCNVHYKPLPLLTAYRTLGWRAADFPHAMDFYSRELTLPLHTLLTEEQVERVVQTLGESLMR